MCLSCRQRLLRENKITVRRIYQSTAPVTGYPSELRQVFMNLVGNAIQAMSEGGTLGVFVRETTDWTKNQRGTMVSVIDTGVGIQPEDAEQLFQPFFSTKSTKGTGLGLWISQGIVQKYEGRITYRTVRGKSGNVTCFRVFLPGIGAFDRVPNVENDTASHEFNVLRSSLISLHSLPTKKNVPETDADRGYEPIQVCIDLRRGELIHSFKAALVMN